MKNNNVVEYHTREQILYRANQLIGIPFKEIDDKGILRTGKGGVGNLIQESWFGIPVNSDPRPDFVEVGVELKAHPFRFKKDGSVVAKERLVCDIINYMEEYKKSFENSAFYTKCKEMLLLPYEDKIGVSKEEFSVAKAVLFSFPEEDLKIIRDDWKKIIEKIRSGHAEQISEGDTLYLGACTKGANAKTLREQPFSNILAKQRAYCLKTSYMTYILQNYIFGSQNDEKIVKQMSLLKDKTFEEYVADKIAQYRDYDVEKLNKLFGQGLNPQAKSFLASLIYRILGIKGNKAEEFIKAGIVIKTIRLNSDNTITESMSFPQFKFKEIANQTWEDSWLNNYLSETRFLFIVFKDIGDRHYVLKGCQFWNMPLYDLKEMRKVWLKTQGVIIDGTSFTYSNGKYRSDLPKIKDSYVGHVRPHARDSSCQDQLPNGEYFPIQCFWLNRNYIVAQIEESLKY